MESNNQADVVSSELEKEYILYFCELIYNNNLLKDVLTLIGITDSLIEYLNKPEHEVFPIDYRIEIFLFPCFVYEQHIFIRGPPKITY